MNLLFDENEYLDSMSDLTVDPVGLWESCLEDLEYKFNEKELNQWVKPLENQLKDSCLLLHAPNSLWVNKVKDIYLNDIKKSIKHHSKGVVSTVRVEVKKTPESHHKPKPKKKVFVGGQLNPNYTFEAFVKGKSNSFAYQTCYEFSKKENKHQYGSIFIHGSSGIGKTHLMHAMAHRYQKHGKSVCYFDKDLFFNETRKAFQGGSSGSIEDFIKEVSKVDLLLLDDVHLINNENAPKISQILMRLFEEMVKDGKKQIVLAADKQPSQMKSFESRVLSRFTGSLLLPINPPDMETRVQILEKKAQNLNFQLPKECAIFMAQNLSSDVRALEGALKTIKVHVDIEGGLVDLNLVSTALRNDLEARRVALSAENIRDAVAKYYEISAKDMVSKKRSRHIARPRQMAMALIRELTKNSFPEIGQVFGGRDHTTVMHACEKIAELKSSDLTTQKDYESLKKMLNYDI